MALEANAPFDELRNIAIAMRDSGYSQAQVLDLFDEFRSQHCNDANESIYNVILEAMDCISGHCSIQLAIFK